MKKRSFLALIICALSLSACNIFNDNDIAISNKYNPPEPDTVSHDPNQIIVNGVESRTLEATPNAYCFKSVAYGDDGVVENTYATGKAHDNGFNPNAGNDYHVTKANNNFDLYVPKDAPKNDKNVVVLFIHGGAWVSGFKSDVNEYVQSFANKGYITATIKYKLMKRSMDDNTLSLFRDLDEIDACIKSIKSFLTAMEFDATKLKLVIGGASSGAHLAMLYSYSRGNDAAMPIQFIIDAVGPVNIKPACWKDFDDASDEVLNAGISASAIAAQEANDNIVKLEIMGEADHATWNDYQTMRIANGMCGLPHTLTEVEASTDSNKEAITNPNAASNAMTQPGGGEDQLSVTYWMASSTNKYPLVCAYAGKDSVVGINQYATLQTAMTTYGISHDYVYFKNSDHTEITKEKDETAYNQFLNKIETKLQSI